VPDPDTVLAGIIIALGLLVFAALAVGTFLVIRDTVRGRGNWGINLSPPGSCPECGASIPMVRVPRSSRQALWGGWTCEDCGAEIDKWGKVIAPPTVPDVLPADEDAPAPPRRRAHEYRRGRDNG
jgi:hypothetical protein